MLASIGSIQRGIGFYAGFTGSVLVGGGITALVGVVQDGNGHVESYFTLGGGLGFGVSGGIEGGAVIPIDPNHKFVTSEFRGRSITYSEGEGLVNGSFGGTFSDKYKGFKNVDNFDMSILESTLQMDTEPKALGLLRRVQVCLFLGQKQILG